MAALSLGACKPRNYNTGLDDGGALPLAWDVQSGGWTSADEQGFSDYVQKVGAARIAGQCRDTVECISKIPPGNLAPEAVPSLGIIDCGRLPFVLRAYYAYRMKLPFAYQTVNNPTLAGRYTPQGNMVTGFRDQSNIRNVTTFFRSAVGSYFTAYYRVPPETDPSAPGAFADTYPVAISKLGVRPGSVYYDVGGHIAIVLAVKPDGSIVTWNGHPDGSNSVRAFTEANFPNPPSGKRNLGGFLRFRSWKATGNTADKKAIPDANQEAYSLEQYDRKWASEGKSFYAWLKQRLGGGGKTDPIDTFSTTVAEICTKLNDRNLVVEKAIGAGLNHATHPGLPRNIYQAEGVWEQFASPSGDLRAKMSLVEIYNLVKSSTAAIAAGDRTQYNFSGSVVDLAKAFVSTWNQFKVKSECNVIARDTNGNPMRVDLDTTLKTAFDWSFDPYHCPELRWGLVGKDSCDSDKQKIAIYNSEAKLRWNTVKDSQVATGFSYGNNSTAPVIDFMPILSKYLSDVVVPPPPPPVVSNIDLTEEQLNFSGGGNDLQLSVRKKRMYSTSVPVRIIGKVTNSSTFRDLVIREGDEFRGNAYARIGTGVFTFFFDLKDEGMHNLQIVGEGVGGVDIPFGQISLKMVP